jgi:hypothetical protein
MYTFGILQVDNSKVQDHKRINIRQRHHPKVSVSTQQEAPM